MKKTILLLLGVVICILITCVFLVRGGIGAYSWNLAVFILSPMAVVALIVQIILLVVYIIRRKKFIPWRVAFIIITLVYALPITVLFGISPITYPTSKKNSSAVTLKNPIEDAILFGGKEYKSHAMWPSECYAYDILKEPYEVGSNNLEDYGIYGEDIFAPITGTVIGMENDEEDITPNTEDFTSLLGNYLFIKIDTTKTYLILAHLRKGSIVVNVGDKISTGQIIGQVGNSGTTSEPHLHIQHQKNNPLTLRIPLCAEGLPIIFEK